MPLIVKNRVNNVAKNDPPKVVEVVKTTPIEKVREEKVTPLIDKQLIKQEEEKKRAIEEKQKHLEELRRQVDELEFKRKELSRVNNEPGVSLVVDGEKKKVSKTSKYLLDMLTLDDQ